MYPYTDNPSNLYILHTLPVPLQTCPLEISLTEEYMDFKTLNTLSQLNLGTTSPIKNIGLKLIMHPPMTVKNVSPQTQLTQKLN